MVGVGGVKIIAVEGGAGELSLQKHIKENICWKMSKINNVNRDVYRVGAGAKVGSGSALDASPAVVAVGIAEAADVDVIAWSLRSLCESPASTSRVSGWFSTTSRIDSSRVRG